MSWGFKPIPRGGTRTQQSAFTTAATKLGMSFGDYMAHFDAGERWCSWHATWEDKAIFTPRPDRSTGVESHCRAAWRERYAARKGEAS